MFHPLLILVSFASLAYGETIFDHAVGPCINSQCQAGYWCLTDQCVPIPSNVTSIGPCVNNGCSANHCCYQNQCFPLSWENSRAICVNGQCPENNWCNGDRCQVIPFPATATGPCINGGCDSNSYCFDEQCYPKPNQTIFDLSVGPCIDNKCQNTHSKSQSGFWCLSAQCVPIPNVATAIGPCVNSGCPGNNYCYQEKCFPLDLKKKT